MSEPVCHLAAEPQDLVQKCSRCGYVLTDYRNAMGIGKWEPCWWAGEVTVWREIRRIQQQGDTTMRQIAGVPIERRAPHLPARIPRRNQRAFWLESLRRAALPPRMERNRNASRAEPLGIRRKTTLLQHSLLEHLAMARAGMLRHAAALRFNQPRSRNASVFAGRVSLRRSMANCATARLEGNSTLQRDCALTLFLWITSLWIRFCRYWI